MLLYSFLSSDYYSQFGVFYCKYASANFPRAVPGGISLSVCWNGLIVSVELQLLELETLDPFSRSKEDRWVFREKLGEKCRGMIYPWTHLTVPRLMS